MLIDIQRNSLDTGISRCQSPDTTPFSGKIIPLRLSEALGSLLKPEVNIFFVYVLFYKAAFINQWHNCPIFHTILDGVFVDELAELGHSVLLFFHQRCTGKANIAGIGEHRPHLGSKQTIIGTMAFIYQEKDIPGQIFMFLFLNCIEFVDDGRDHIGLAVFEKIQQVLPTGGPGRIQPGMGEGGSNLPVQLFSICDNHHTRTAISQLHQNILCQHHHGQAFAAALGMPDHAALPVALFVGLLDGLDDLLDGKVLLIPAYFFHVGVEKHKVPDQFHNPLFAEQRNQVAVLFGGHAVRDIAVQCIFQKSCVLLLPHIPEFFRGGSGGILHGVLVGGHDNLSKFIELRDILALLVADVLFHCLVNTDLWSLTLDNRKRDTIDEQHKIRAGIMKLVPAVYRKFIGYVKQVVLRVLPVNILQIEA